MMVLVELCGVIDVAKILIDTGWVSRPGKDRVFGLRHSFSLTELVAAYQKSHFDKVTEESGPSVLWTNTSLMESSSNSCSKMLLVESFKFSTSFLNCLSEMKYWLHVALKFFSLLLECSEQVYYIQYDIT